MTRSNSAPRLSLATSLAYAAPGFFLAVVGAPLFIYVPKFYTDVVGVDAAVLGGVILAARLLDGVTDPLAGWLSDRTRTRFGRRRPFIAMAVVLQAVFLVAMYAPPSWDAAASAWWFGASLIGLTLFWTLVEAPWEALGPELTFDYDERTRLMSLRDGALLAGALMAAGAPLAIQAVLHLPDDPAGERTKFLWFGALYAPLLVGSCWLCVAVCKEPPTRSRRREARPPLRQAAAVFIRNRPFLILLASYTVGAIGANLPATLILYYVDHVLQVERAEPFLGVYIITGVACLPLWSKAAGRWGKKRAYMAAMAVNTGAFVGVFFLGAGDAWLYGVLTAASGVGFGAVAALPSSMQADVIDYDEHLSGQRREGVYIGVWSVAKKAASAVGVGAALPVLGWMGYQSAAETQPEPVLLTLRALYALVPCACNAVAIAIVWRYPIGKVEHERILDAVEARRRGDDPTTIPDPLRSRRM